PNLFDMFKVDVVPSVVWTNRAGLDDIGSGCETPPDILKQMIQVDGPNDELITVEKPTCLPAPDSSYYKLTGALKMEYVLDRFEGAGVPKFAVDTYRERLAVRTANVHQGDVVATTGN